MVFTAISEHVHCECGSNIAFQERSPRGLGFKIVIVCPNCPAVEIPSCKYMRNAYEINRRIVLAVWSLGVGLNGILKFCAFMELPRPIFQSFYDRIIEIIVTASVIVREFTMKKAVDKKRFSKPGKKVIWKVLLFVEKARILVTFRHRVLDWLAYWKNCRCPNKIKIL